MLGSLMTTIMGSPMVGANVTVEESNSSPTSSQTSNRNRHISASHSSALELDGSEICSPAISPVKVERENTMSSMSHSYSSEDSEYNVSLALKLNSSDVNLDNPVIQKIALQYLLEKIRDLESLVIQSTNDNKTLQDEIAALYRQNDALSNENITISNMIAARNEEVAVLKEEFAAEKDQLRFVIGSIGMGYKDDKNLFTDMMIKSSEEIETLKQAFTKEKDDLWRIMNTNTLVIQKDMDRFNADINLLTVSVNNLAQQYDNEMTVDIRKLESLIKDVQENVARNQSTTEKEMHRIDLKANATNQYNRRQNLIIDGIPDHIQQDALEGVCMDIIQNVGFALSSKFEIVGCHRLLKREGDVTAPTIIRFVNRKVVEFSMKNRWRLKHLRSAWSLSFREDLCDDHLPILRKCEELKADGKIAKVYTHNGFVKIVRNPRDRPMKLSHMNDLVNLFNVQVLT